MVRVPVAELPGVTLGDELLTVSAKEPVVAVVPLTLRTMVPVEGAKVASPE